MSNTTEDTTGNPKENPFATLADAFSREGATLETPKGETNGAQRHRAPRPQAASPAAAAPPATAAMPPEFASAIAASIGPAVATIGPAIQEAAKNFRIPMADATPYRRIALATFIRASVWTFTMSAGALLVGKLLGPSKTPGT